MAVLCLAALLNPGGAAQAEGSRTLFPSGYLPGEGGQTGATISSLNHASATYMGAVRQRNFLYVYAREGEYILLGTSDARSAIRLYEPPQPGETLEERFGTPGLEDPAILGAGLAIQGCGAGTGNITSRALELAGPRSVDGAGNPAGYVPCYYEVPVGGEGIYGLVFTTAAVGIDRWDITVRAGQSSTVDIPGRAFTYSFSGNTTGRTYATHYYVTNDGYRYAQTMRGLAPLAYVLYSNPQGFLDAAGNPLYSNVRGQTHTLSQLASSSYFRPAGTGIQAQRPTYPMFFSNVVDPGVATPDGLQATLDALDIPAVPDDPIVLSASFSAPQTGETTTYVGRGGTFTISTLNALSYQIVIKGGSTPAHDDPAHPENRVLTGIANGTNQRVHWNGLTNSGAPMPAGSGFAFEVSGRAGEVHFPFLDAEANLSGGPTVTRLNGTNSGDRTVYYDDRGYTTNGVDVGVPGGHLCGPSSTNEQPTPTHSLTGVDSGNPNLNGSGNYYRSWGSINTGNTGNDCAAGGYFGDAKGMDLWTFIKSDPPPGVLELTILDVADVAATASIPETVVPGTTSVIVARFGNIGSRVADDIAYSIQLPPGLAGVTCSGATCSYDASSGEVTISGLPLSLSAGQWTNSIALEYTAPANGNVPVEVAVATSSAQPQAPAPQAADTASGTTLVATGGTVADVLAQVDAPLVAAPAGTVSVPVVFRNLGPLAATGLDYSMTLSPGLAGVACASPAICNYDAVTGAVDVTGLPAALDAGDSTTLTLSFSAPGSGAVETTAAIATATNENDVDNNSVTAFTTVSNEAVADVTASVAPPASVAGGTTVDIPVVFRNLGPLSASGVSYSVTLASGLTGVTCSAPVTCAYSAVTGVVTLTGGAPATLGNGAIVSFSVSYAAPHAGGAVPVAASISTSTGESNTTNNSVSSQTAVVPNTHSVTFDSNGGSAVPPLDDVVHGQTISEPAQPARPGHTLTGWYRDPALTDLWDFATDTITASTTLYAGWQINMYGVSYSPGPNGSISGATAQVVPHGGSAATVTAVPNTGYHFVSWSDGVTTAARTDTNVTGPFAVLATFAINEYALTYSAGANGTITGDSSQTVNHGANGATVTATPNPGYHFVAWSDGVTTATRADLAVTGPLTATATFAINEYALTYAAGPNGTIVGDSSQTVNHGTNGTAVTATPDPGYHFVAWSDGVTTATRADLGVTGPLTATAMFAINEYALTYAAGLNGSITGESAQLVEHGADGTSVTAVPDPGYRFVAWSDGVTTASRTDLHVTGTLAVTATFARDEYTLSYAAGQNGTISGASHQIVVHGGNGSTVTAVPSPGYEFGGWSDGVATASRTDLGVTADISVTAIFEQGPQTVEERAVKVGEEHVFQRPTASAELAIFRLTRGGAETFVENPTRADFNGALECDGSSCRFLASRSGRYEITFIEGSNRHVFVFTVHPNVGFATERQRASAGMPARVRVVLDDLPIEEAAYVTYSVDGGTAIGNVEPADLLTRMPFELRLDVGGDTDLTCFETGTCYQEITITPTTSAGDIRLSLLGSDGASVGDYPTHTIELAPAALVPINARLVIAPSHTVVTGTPATATLELPPGNYSIDWTRSNGPLGIGSATDPVAALRTDIAGTHLVHVVVHDRDNPSRPPLELRTWLRVIAPADYEQYCGALGCDDYGTRIPLPHQTPSCGLGLDDLSGSPPHLLMLGLKGWTWDSADLCLETLPGYGIRLGTTSFFASPFYGAGIEHDAVASYGDRGAQPRNGDDYAYDHIGLYYDFEIMRLDMAGQAAAITVPLPRNLTIPAGAAWRKYHPVNGWSTFVEDAANRLHSARRLGAGCPSPLAPVWDSNPGLVTGLDCIRLTIEDGGPNDMDDEVNGVVVDPGVLGIDAGGHKITSSDRSGGGALSPLALLALGLLALARRKRAFMLALLALAGFSSTANAQEDEVRQPGWFIGATPARAFGEVDGDDVTRGLRDHGINAGARVEDQDRNAWRVFGGYRFNKYLSLAAGYTDLGVVTTYVDGNPVDLNDIPEVLPASGAGWELSVAGYLPLGERVDLYARLGAWHWEALYHLHETGQKRRPKASDTDALGGIGVRYRFNPRWHGDVGFDRYRIDGQDVQLLGLSVVRQLGQRD